MPPRFADWTALIDNVPTAFRARDAADLLPTLHQLKRKNPNVVLKWFSGGRLWDSPEAATEARPRRPPPAGEKAGGPARGPRGARGARMGPRAIDSARRRTGRERRGPRGPSVPRGGRRRRAGAVLRKVG